MRKRKHEAGLFGLLIIAVLAVMAFASSAQAAIPRFLVGGTLAGAANILGEQEGRTTLSIPSLNTEINCESLTLLVGKIVTSTDATATLLYEGCTVLELKASLAELPCTVVDTHTASSLPHITVLNTLLKPIEFGDGSLGVLMTSTAFINYKSGTNCPLALKTELKGSVCAKITAATNNTTEPLFQFSEVIQKAAGCGDKLLYGLQEAFISGNAKIWVAGKTSTWGVALD